LVTKLTSIGSGSITLADNAVNKTQPGAANITVYREVSTDINNPLKIDWTLTTSCRATLTATVFDPLGALDIRVGMPVYLYDDGNGDYFGGSIDSVKARNIPGRVPNPNPIYWDISCVSWAQVLDRRLVNRYIPPPLPDKGNPLQAPGHDPAAPAIPAAEYGCSQSGQFINMNMGDIVNQLVFNYCESEGLSTNLGNHFPSGTVIAFFQANGGQDTIAQAVDNALQAGADQTHSYVWWVDPWKKVYIVEATQIPAPWHIDETSSDPNVNDSSILLEVSLETTREKLCNDVNIDSPQTIGASQSEYYYGDPSAHSYPMGRPIGTAPFVTLNTTSGVVHPRIGVKGADDPLFADLYWSQGDNSIEQAILTTLDAPSDLNDSTNTINVISPLKKNLDNQGYKIQIDQEWLQLISGSTTKNWFCQRGVGIRGVSSDRANHTNGATIYPAAPLTGKHETIVVNYSPLTKQTFTASNDTSISTRLSIEGGTGKWQSQISIGNPFYDVIGGPSGTGAAFATAFVTDFGDPAAAFSADTYRPGLAVGQLISIHLLRPPVNANFLIDQMNFTVEDKRQKWSFHAINGALIGDWRKAFIALSNQFSVLGGASSQMMATAGAAGQPIWNAGGAFPVSGDPIFTASSFTIEQDYVVGSDGNALGSEVTVTGNQAMDTFNKGIPILWKVRREYVSGALAQVGIINSLNPGHIVLGANPPANMWKGRVMSKLANRYGSINQVPILDFTITSHDNTGDFIVTPDPVAAGCQTGDLFTIRTGRAAGTAAVPGSDAVVTNLTYSDPTWSNVYNNVGSYNGLKPSANVGNFALVIAGTGAFQEAQMITANDQTSITISPGWVTLPDATSCIIIVDTTAQITPPQNASTAATVEAVLPVALYNGMVVRVEGYLDPQSILEGSLETATMRELYVWGAQNTRVVYFGDTLGMFKQDKVLIFDTSGVTPLPPTTTLAADLGANPATDTTVTLAANYTPPNGTVIQVGGASGERMYVTAGSGTTTLTVNRAWVGGSAIATHASGDPVAIPGAFSWTVIPFSAVPNQEFYFVKAWWGGDINYVIIRPAPTDPNWPTNELLDGEPFHVLGDISSANGTYHFKVPQV
jgi:hypothetical protein